MLKMVDGTGIIGLDMVCPLGISTPQPPNYDRVELEGTGMLVLPNSLDAPLERLELGGKTEQVTTTGVNLFDEKLLLDFDSENYDKTQSGSGFYYYKFPVSGTVTVSTKNANKNGEYLTVGIKPDGSDKTWLSHGSAAISKYKTLTPEDGNIYLGVNNNLERVESMIQNTGGIIINEGSVAKPYEPYTGGKPSPSPEYPQEIKNVGKWNEEKQKYEVDVKVVGKNLFDVNYFSKNENYQNKDGDATYWKYATLKVEPNTTYTVSKGLVTKVNGGINSVFNFAGALFFYNDTNSVKITSKDNGILYVMLYNRNEDANVLKEMDIQVELGEKLTEYQPYKEQTLTITSDRPITKWDRLVEQGGEIGWLYKSRIAEIPKTGYALKNTNENRYGVYFSKSSIFKDAVVTKGSPEKDSNIFTHFKPGNPYASNGNIAWLHVAGGNTDLRIKVDDETINTVELFEQYISDKDIQILYETESTEFIPLPQSEQNAIRALKTYYPTTVITADGGELDPDIKVTYRKEI